MISVSRLCSTWPILLIGIIFGTSTRLTLELAGVGHDGVGLLLRDAHDFLLAGNRHSLAASVFDEARALGFRIVEEALTLTNDLARLREFARERIADFIHNLKSRGDVDLAKIVLAEHRFRILKKDREFLNETENSCFVHCIPFMPAANMLHFNTLRKAAGCFHCNR